MKSNFREFYLQYTRDQISFWLIVINLSIALLAVANAMGFYARIQQEKSMESRYPYVVSGRISESDGVLEGNYSITREDYSKYARIIEQEPIERKKIGYTCIVGNSSEWNRVWLDMSDEYIQDIQHEYEWNGEGICVYIGSGLVDYVQHDDSGEYILINGRLYYVKGICKNIKAAGEDCQVIIPYTLLGKQEKNEVLDILSEMSVQGLYYSVSSEKPIDTQALGFMQELRKDQHLCNEEVIFSEKDSHYMGTMKLRYTSIVLTFVIFFINFVSVFVLWRYRMRKDISIQKKWGKTYQSLVKDGMLYMLKCLFVAIPVYGLIYLIYIGF